MALEIPPHSPPGRFQTTRWSLVKRAGTKEGEDSLAVLCRGYWYPLYAYLRRRGLPVDDAQDLTQGFFLHLFSNPILVRADPEKGRFRSFLLGAMNHFLANERRRQTAGKRGGGIQAISFDSVEAERRFAMEPVDGVSPEVQFERSWAYALLERVFARLGEDYSQVGKGALFAALHPYLAGKAGQRSYDEVADELGMNANSIGVAIHRMRRRYGELVRAEIAQTVSSSEEIEPELAHLFEIFARV